MTIATLNPPNILGGRWHTISGKDSGSFNESRLVQPRIFPWDFSSRSTCGWLMRIFPWMGGSSMQLHWMGTPPHIYRSRLQGCQASFTPVVAVGIRPSLQLFILMVRHCLCGSKERRVWLHVNHDQKYMEANNLPFTSLLRGNKKTYWSDDLRVDTYKHAYVEQVHLTKVMGKGPGLLLGYSW